MKYIKDKYIQQINILFHIFAKENIIKSKLLTLFFFSLSLENYSTMTSFAVYN